jgi:transmembrane sensor
MDPNETNNLFARWVNGEISEEEKNALEKAGDADLLRNILSTVDEWSLPEMKESTFEKINERISAPPEKKVVPLYKKTWAILAAAATLVVTVGLIWLLEPPGDKPNQFAEFSCNPGETKSFVLPDNSSITIFGKSKVSYDKTTFASRRVVNLEGEGYFEVNQKGNFEVKYNTGTVRVLGTKFNILAGEEISTVKCYEGKVEVEMQNEKVLLDPGAGVRKIKAEQMQVFKVEEVVMTRAADETRFDNTPLQEVCTSLSLYYDVQIVPGENVDLKRNFTGRFTQSNLDSALKMVFSPMNIVYSKNGNTITLKNK